MLRNHSNNNDFNESARSLNGTLSAWIDSTVHSFVASDQKTRGASQRSSSWLKW